MAQNKNIIKKSFNLKVAEGFNNTPVPFEGDNFNDIAELGEDQFQFEDSYQENVNSEPSKLKSASELQSKYLDRVSQNEARVFFIGLQNGDIEREQSIGDILENYYAIDSQTEQGQELAEELFHNYLPDNYKSIKPEGLVETEGYGSPQEELSMGMKNIELDIQKIAKQTIEIKKANKKSFNLLKTAQHKTEENVIMYGPGETKIDPFYRQPVSDWSIVERNKGFGLVVDNIWNIDYESIWRSTIMDKYSRSYKDKDGNWVGGYLNKRFETDKNIPASTNIQLKPGQKRKPILPEYGNTESRLEAARASGQIEGGPVVSGEPFNWKEAQSKKKR